MPALQWVRQGLARWAAAALLALGAGGCGADSAPVPAAVGGAQAVHEAAGGEHGAGEHGAGETEPRALRLSAQQLERAAIAVVEAGPGEIDSGVALLGEVVPNGERLAHIVPRFPGIVREVHKRVGDAVRTGDVLAVVESSESLSRYEIRTLIGGVVLERHVTLGEAVDRDKQTFVIADLSELWVELSIYQKDLFAIRVGQAVQISGGGEARAQGAIAYVTPAVDPLTRTATARVVLPNEDGAWRPGMFVKARALSSERAPVVVPQSALQRLDGEAIVFVQTAAGFEPRAVQVGREGEHSAEIVLGLAAGERVAARNAFLLKAELGKSRAEHGH